MKKICGSLGIVLLSATLAQADIIDQLSASQKTAVPDTAQTFCQKGEKPEDCYGRFDVLFHKALEKNRPMFGECIKRASKTFSKDILDSFAKGPVTLPNGKSIGLYDAMQILASENATSVAACILGLMHTISDDMSRNFGIVPPEIDHLQRFDQAEKDARAEQPPLENANIPELREPHR